MMDGVDDGAVVTPVEGVVVDGAGELDAFSSTVLYICELGLS